MNEKALINFKSYFQQMKLKETDALDDIYSDSVHFKDPLHEITGLKDLKQYFEKLNKNLIEGKFSFTDEIVAGDKVFLSWKMTIKLKKPKKRVSASGISVLVIKEKIISQRDYFDAGELFYEHIPLLGKIVKMVKKQIAK